MSVTVAGFWGKVDGKKRSQLAIHVGEIKYIQQTGSTTAFRGHIHPDWTTGLAPHQRLSPQGLQLGLRGHATRFWTEPVRKTPRFMELAQVQHELAVSTRVRFEEELLFSPVGSLAEGELVLRFFARRSH